MRRLTHYLAWTALLIAFGAWGLYGYMISTLQSERIAYATRLEENGQRQIREQSLTRLQAVIRDTEQERTALNALIDVSVVDAVDIVEAAGISAGAREVRIGSATPVSLPTKEISALSVVVTAAGTFPALMRAVALFESLPVPSIVEQVDIEKNETSWLLTVRLRLYLAANAT